MKRREFMVLAAVSASALGASRIFGAPSTVGAKSTRFDGVTLRINGYGGDYDRIMTETISKPLEEKYGLKVVFTPGSSQAAVTKVIATPNNPAYDVILCDSPSMPDLLAAGIIEPVSNNEVASVSRLLPGMREFGDFGVPFTVSSMAVAFNSKHVDEPLTSYADLARAGLKGRVGMFNLENTGGLLVLIALAEANGGGIDNIAPGFEALAKIADNVVSTTPSSVNLLQLFQQEEVWAAAFWDGRINSLRLGGMPIEMVVPKEGVYSVRSYFSPIKNSKHPEAVQVFMEEVLSGDLIGEVATFFRYAPTTDIDLPKDIGDTILAYGERAKMIKLVDWQKVSEHRSDWFNRFNREFR